MTKNFDSCGGQRFKIDFDYLYNQQVFLVSSAVFFLCVCVSLW